MCRRYMLHFSRRAHYFDYHNRFFLCVEAWETIIRLFLSKEGWFLGRAHWIYLLGIFDCETSLSSSKLLALSF